MTKKSIEAGLKIVGGLLLTIVVLNLLSLGLRLIGGDRFPLLSIFWTAVSLWLCWNVYKGKGWARVVLGGWLTVQAISIGFVAVAALSAAAGHAAAPASGVVAGLGAVFLILALLLLASALALFIIQPVRDYFEYVSNSY